MDISHSSFVIQYDIYMHPSERWTHCHWDPLGLHKGWKHGTVIQYNFENDSTNLSLTQPFIFDPLIPLFADRHRPISSGSALLRNGSHSSECQLAVRAPRGAWSFRIEARKYPISMHVSLDVPDMRGRPR